MKHTTRLLWVPLLFALFFGSLLFMGSRTAAARPAPRVDHYGPASAPKIEAFSSYVAAAPSASQGLSQTFYVQADTWVNEAEPSTNYGSASSVYVGVDGSTSDERYTLLGFDISSLPENVVVFSATLEAYSIINLALAPEVVEPNLVGEILPEALLSSWDESAVTWNTRPTASHQGDPASSYRDRWTTWDVTNIVEGWVTGTLINHGIQLRLQSGSGLYYFFARPDQNQPRLTIYYEPAPCVALTGATIGGPSAGVVDTDYAFNADLTPADASTPLTYTWEATDHAGSIDTPTATFAWGTPGTKVVTLTVENCGGAILTTRTVEISPPPSDCEAPLTGLSLTGPVVGAQGEIQSFTAAALPPTATLPLTYTWEATGQTPVVQSGAFTETTVDWSWSTTGTKRITVTAENCGGTFTTLHDVEIVESAQLPDLSISGAWYESDVPRVGYILRNLGESTAPAGHLTRLYRDADLLGETSFDEALIPGALRAGYVPAAWSCPSSLGADLRLEADAADQVSESDELNNAFVSPWACDLKPPEIILGPVVLTTTENTALIRWKTDEPTRHRVDYGRYTYLDTSVQDPNLVTEHQTTLTGLEAGSTYRYQVFVIDEAGNVANSQELFFETQPLGSDPPEVKDVALTDYPFSDYEFYSLKASLVDARGIERVEFYFDGLLVGTEYSGGLSGYSHSVIFSPHALGFTRDAFFGQAHEIEARAYTLLGLSDSLTETVTPDFVPQQVTLAITAPGEGEELYIDGDTAPAGTSLEVTVLAIEYEWACTWPSAPTPPGLDPVRCEDVTKRAPKTLHLRLDGDLVAGVTPQPDAWVQTMDVDLEGLSPGPHILRVTARAHDGETTGRLADFELVQGEPSLVLHRTVARDDNLFEVALTLENRGSGTARVDYLVDAVQGFQVLHRSTLPGLRWAGAAGYYQVETAWSGGTPDSRPLIRVDFVGSGGVLELGPGESFTVNYELVPILYESLALSDYSIGTTPVLDDGTFIVLRTGNVVEIRSLIASGAYVDDLATGTTVPLDQAVLAAAGTADYLLVTSPAQLGAHAMDSSSLAGLGDLVSQMARLASVQEGVLAYVEGTIDSGVLDDLLETGGLWADALHPDFRETSEGYVLFVGEEEILPVQGAGYGVNYSDLRYASTGGAARPELVFGRLVGDEVGTLRKPLEASIAYHRSGAAFDRSHAVLVSGRSEGEGTFWSDVGDMANRLSGTTVKKIRWKSHGDPGAPEGEEWRSYFNVLNDFIQDRDVVVFRGHGGDDSWSPGVFSWDVGGLNISAATRPFVMALACHTGDFKGGNDYNIAEAFAKNGAAVYIGSMETSSRIRNSDAARGFFNRWNPSRSVGDTFHELQRDKWDDFDWGIQSISWERWIYDYLYFGDPKYGAPRTPVAAAESTEEPSIVSRQEQALNEIQAQTTLEIRVPDFEVTPTEEGHDYVAFPNADRLAKEGDYLVPLWTVTLNYPPGQRVQAVTLLERGGLVVTSGLQIPTATFRIDTPTAVAPAAPLEAAAPVDGWHPQIDTDYRWVVSELPDGATELKIILYPFLYNPATTDVRFYRDFTFQVETLTTTVALEGLETAGHEHPQKDPVTFDLTIVNSGAAQDVIVRPVVKSLEGREVAGLPLRTLHDLQGRAQLSLDWDSQDLLEAGDYYVEVTLLDGKGQTLDRDLEEFTLGVHAGEVTALTATPGAFYRGEEIALSMVFSNTGTVPISGTAFIRIQDTRTFSDTAVFTRTLDPLAPGSALTMNEVWNTGADGGLDYRVVGYVKYGGAVSEASIIELVARGRVYLPLVTRNVP